MTKFENSPKQPALQLIFRYALPTLVQLSGMVFLSLKPADDLPKFELPFLDKAVHFTLFFVLSLLISRYLVSGLRWTDWKRAAFIAIALSAAYGVVDEYIQSFSPGRQPDVFDFVADVAGATAGALFTPIYLEIKKRFYARADS